MNSRSPKFSPPSARYRLTPDEVSAAASLQAAGATIGDVAELHGISIVELEPQVGVTRALDGAAVALGPWRLREARA